jgi:hypothetical protein
MDIFRIYLSHKKSKNKKKQKNKTWNGLGFNITLFSLAMAKLTDVIKASMWKSTLNMIFSVAKLKCLAQY